MACRPKVVFMLLLESKENTSQKSSVILQDSQQVIKDTDCVLRMPLLGDTPSCSPTPAQEAAERAVSSQRALNNDFPVCCHDAAIEWLTRGGLEIIVQTHGSL